MGCGTVWQVGFEDCNRRHPFHFMSATDRWFMAHHCDNKQSTLNGGAYNVLLNTTSKKSAAVAVCLSILSYMATAVVSASSAMAYLQYIYHSSAVVSLCRPVCVEHHG